MKVGDIVRIKDPYSFKTGELFVSQGSLYVINNILNIHCKCTGNNLWTLYDLCIPREKPDTIFSLTCRDCKMKLYTSRNLHFQASAVEPVSTQKIDIEQVETHLEMMKMVISGKMKTDVYRRILSMIESDPEMKSLGLQLLKNIEDGHITI